MEEEIFGKGAEMTIKDSRIENIKKDMRMGPLFLVGWLESFFLNSLEKNPVMTREDYDKMIDAWLEWNEHFRREKVPK